MKRALAVLVLLSWTASAAPLVFGPEVPVSAPVWGETPYFKHQPSIATDGANYLAAWVSGAGLFAARVAHDGPLLDPVNLYIGQGSSPAVVWTGRVYVIAWVSGVDYSVWATVVTRDGEITASKRISDDDTAFVRAATNGESIAITARGNDSLVLLIDENLELIARHVVRPNGRFVWSLDVASDGDDYLVAVAADGAHWAAFTVPLEGNGTLGAFAQVPESLDVRGIALASDGQNYLLAFDRLEDIHTLVLSPRNEPVGSVRTVVPRQAPPSSAYYLVNVLTMVWRGGEYLLTYLFDVNSYQQKLLRIGADGSAVGSPSNTFGRSQSGVALAARADGSGAALWFGGNRFFADGDVRSHVSFFDDVSLAAGAPFSGEVAPARSAHAQRGPALAPVEGSLAVAWQESSATTREIRLAYGGRTVVVATPEVFSMQFIDVVWDGEELHVFWQYEGNQSLFMRRYTRALEPLEEEPEIFPLIEDAWKIDGIAGGGGEVLVVWKTTANTHLAEIIGRQPAPLTSRGFHYSEAKPVWDGTQFVVFTVVPVTHPQFPHDPEPAEATIVATRVSRSGAISESVLVYQQPGAKIIDLDASANIVAWQELDGVRVARYDGAALSNVRRLAWRTDELQEQLKVVALTDGGADVYWIVPVNDGWNLHVEVDRISSDLQPGGTTSFTIAGHDFAATATGKTARIAYARLSVEDGWVDRVFLRSSGAFRRRAVR